jgi:hypothetical protein
VNKPDDRVNPMRLTVIIMYTFTDAQAEYRRQHIPIGDGRINLCRQERYTLLTTQLPCGNALVHGQGTRPGCAPRLKGCDEIGLERVKRSLIPLVLMRWMR